MELIMQIFAVQLTFLIVLGVVIPILDAWKVTRPIISMRWTVVTVLLVILISVVVDAVHLQESVRLALVIGILIIVGIYLVARTLEKFGANGWSLGFKGFSFQKGDLKADIHMEAGSPKVEVKEGGSEEDSGKE